MNGFESIADPIGRAVLHSVWEAAALAGLFGVVRVLLRSAQGRYVVGCITLALMVVAPIATLLSHPAAIPRDMQSAGVTSQPLLVASIEVPARPPAPSHPTGVTKRSIPQDAMILWSIGVLIVSLWQIQGWIAVRSLIRRSQPADAPQIELLRRLRARVQIRFPITMRVCDQLTTPALVGWLRPVILIPPAALCDLPVDYLESLLLHELAHIRRHDYLVNLLQIAAETLLFYHSAAWWIGRVIRQEREYCCDDEAIRNADSRVYARALATMESLRAGDVGSLALAARGGNLLHRIRRITRSPGNCSRPTDVSLVLLTLLGLVIVVSACYAARPRPADEAKPATTQAATSRPASATVASLMDRILPEDLKDDPEVIQHRIQIAPGDEVVIRLDVHIKENLIAFYNMSETVDPAGMVKLNYFKQDYHVAGLTQDELGKLIVDELRAAGHTERDLGFALWRPKVRPSEKIEYTVSGSRLGGKKTSSYALRVLEAVLDAKGKNEPRAQRIYIIRKDPKQDGATRHIEIPVDRLLAGDISCNIVVRANDTIVVEPSK